MQAVRKTSFTSGRKIVAPSSDPVHEAVGRIICGLLERNPDESVRGITGAYWTQWDYTYLHRGEKFHADLAEAGFVIMPAELTPALLSTMARETAAQDPRCPYSAEYCRTMPIDTEYLKTSDVGKRVKAIYAAIVAAAKSSLTRP